MKTKSYFIRLLLVAATLLMLFSTFAGAAHKHTLTLHEAKAATCTTAGNNAYYTCSGCGKVYKDAAATTETTVSAQTIKKLYHYWSSAKTTKAPTCTATGVKTYTCTRKGCGATKTAEIAATGHKIEKVEAKAATCTTKGNNEYYICTVCSKAFTDAAGTTATTVSAQTLKAKSHYYGSIKTTTKPTCVSKGIKTYTCIRSGCGYKKCTTIAALGHNLTKVEATAATCTTRGNKEYYTCSRCLKVFTDSTAQTVTSVSAMSIKAKSHYYGSVKVTTKPTCVSKGVKTYTCIRSGCGYKKCTTVDALGHNLTKVEAKASTCTEKGNKEYYYCSRCEKAFTDSTCQTVVKVSAMTISAKSHYWGKSQVTTKATCTTEGVRTYYCTRTGCDGTKTASIAALGHKLVKVAAKAPTCTTEGTNEYYKCSTCSKLFKDAEGTTSTTLAAETIAPAGHNLVTVEAKAPDCTNVGWNKYEYCTKCSYTTYSEIPAKGHTIVNHAGQLADCTTGGWNAYETCSVCDYTTYEEIPPLGHDIIVHEEKAPTCTEIGWDEYETCSRCDYTTYEEIEMFGHDIIIHDPQEPTCTEVGWDTYESCTLCDYSDYVEIPMLGHDYIPHEAKAPTCTEIGWEEYNTCSRCDYTDYSEIPALGHNWINEQILVQPTCTTTGSASYTCSREGCGKTKTETLDALGHAWNSGTVITEPTCITTGSMHFTCTRKGCNAEKTEVIATLPHKMTKTEGNPATCLAGGYNTYYTCSECKNVYKDEEGTQITTVAAEQLAPLGHDIISHKAKAATCTDDGWTAYDTCSRCDYTTFEKTDKLGHDYTAADSVYGSTVHSLICNRCGNKDTSVDSFNQLVNAVKSKFFMNIIDPNTNQYIHSVSIISKSKMSSTSSNIKFGAYTSMVKKLYAEEMDENEISYLACRRNRWIGFIPLSNTSTSGNTPVSSISEGEATISVEKISGLAASAILSDFDSSFKIGNTDYDISDFKSKSVSGDIIKVTVTPVQEKFFGTNGVKNLASTDKTVLQKLTGYDIRLDAAEFGDDYTLTQEDKDDESYYMKMDMELNQITSNATVVYYFDAATLKPIAARYDVTVDTDQDITMLIKILKSELLKINGTMDSSVKTTTSTVYLFSDFYN